MTAPTKQSKEGVNQLSDNDRQLHRFHHHRGEIQEARNCKPHRAPNAAPGFHGNTLANIKIPSITRHVKSTLVTEKTLPSAPFISQVPLKIKVCGQRGSLGISIAGGKGSLPYKDQDEGIFISRIVSGGPSEKAGIHVGDRLVEVNGLSMLEATHLEAVSALRNAGSCIKMKVVRERLLSQEWDPDGPGVPLDLGGLQLCGLDSGSLWIKQPMMETMERGLFRKNEATVCNGNGTCYFVSDLNKINVQEAEAIKKNSFLEGKQTMAIPRIILTHPSTSDEDVEFLTQFSSRPLLYDTDKPDKDKRSDCCDSAFYPP